MNTFCKLLVGYILFLLQDDVNTCFSSSNKVVKVKQSNQLKPKENKFYYTNGDTVTFTCENLSRDHNFTIYWQEDLGMNTTGKIKIQSPAKIGNNYSLSVTLNTYDNGSIWYCFMEEDPMSSAIEFVTLESTAKNNYNLSFMDNNLKITTRLLDPSEYLHEITSEKKGSQCDWYVLENGRIVNTTTNESNLCLRFVDDPNDSFHIRRFSVDYEVQNLTNDEEFTTTTTPLLVTFDPEDDNSEKFWIVEIGSAVLLILIIIVITIITIFICRRRKKNKPTAEELYATANEVQYVELQLQDTNTSFTRNVMPYAQVIGFMKKNKNK